MLNPLRSIYPYQIHIPLGNFLYEQIMISVHFFTPENNTKNLNLQSSILIQYNITIGTSHPISI